MECESLLSLSLEGHGLTASPQSAAVAVSLRGVSRTP